VPVAFDLADERSIAAAAARCSDVTLLVNNASTAAFAGPLDADPAAVRREMAVNYDGTYAAIRAFVPVLERNGGGGIVNVLSLLSLASTPPMTGYSASKAAAHSLTQALRPVLAPRGVTVHGVYPAGIDTDMLAGFDVPKAPPADVAARILDGLTAGEEDIFPDANAEAMSSLWRSDPKAVERALAGAAG
jgi:NAD(P)-dependent dehydrogenase (short-subunit alcohol dehydrogenase family)